MKRRTLKKQIPLVVEQLSTPVRKYLTASNRVAPDVLYSYERAIEIGLVKLMTIHLTLDLSWPHKKRWLDGLNEDFSWERKSGVMYGSGELFWGHWPEVSLKITGAPFTAMLRHCPRHGIEYRLKYEDGDRVRSFSSRR
jgi:hypothetical protein